jgi:hypothetical protein
MRFSAALWRFTERAFAYNFLNNLVFGLTDLLAVQSSSGIDDIR